MKIEKRGKNYRVQKQYKGKRYSYSFDHKPTQREINERFMKELEYKRANGRLTFEDAAAIMLKEKDSVLTPATIRCCSGRR